MLDEGHDYRGPSASFLAQPHTSAVVGFIRGRSSSTTAIRRPAKPTVRDDDDTQSQQLTVRSPSRESLMKRALSFQFGRSKEVEKLDPETILKIKMRYKDVSKYVIWPECAFPHDYNHGYLTFNPDKSKRTAIRYSHAGNHQAAVLRLNAIKWDDVDVRRKLLNGEIDASAFIRPGSSKGGISKFYHQLPPLSRVPDLASVAEEQRTTDSVNEECAKTQAANIEDERTPAPPITINSVRRSESSDEEEPIIGITARTDSVFFGDEEVPDIQVLRL
uniref:Uncharacterized protein n=1 Tax=Parascaris univalens TaxID=6257 RepID=A0A915CBU0_PARUN